jgi:bifunctional non-homologous end joining protein LigD
MRDGQRFIEVGNVTIPPNKEIPALNSIVEVRYLYAYEGGSLYQPTYLGPRDDLRVEDCGIAQLKYKKAVEE